MKAFAEIPDDERREWRDNPVTQAFLAWLRKEVISASESAIAAVRDAAENGTSLGVAGQCVGKLDAFESVHDLATRETFE